MPQVAVVRTSTWERKLREKAIELAKTLETGYMDLARILYDVVDKPAGGNPTGEPLYRSWGFKTFKEYVDKELGFSIKTAQRLRNAWYNIEIRLADLPAELKERIVALGMSKVRELTRILTLQNAEEWVTRAESVSCVQLVEDIRDYAGTHPDSSSEEIQAPESDPSVIESRDKKRLRWFRTILMDEEIDLVEAALRRALDLLNTPLPKDKNPFVLKKGKKGYLLSMICTDFLATNDFLACGMDAKLRWLRKIETLTGLRFIVCDQDTTALLYGMKTLEKMFESYNSGRFSVVEEEDLKNSIVDAEEHTNVIPLRRDKGDGSESN